MKKTIQLIGILCVLITTFSNAQEAIPAAEEVMNIASQEAKKENKNVFLMFHASWCGWCHRMDDNMQKKVCKELFDTNYIITHLTVKENKENKHLENPGALALLYQLNGKKQGLPYWVIFDKKGQVESEIFKFNERIEIRLNRKLTNGRSRLNCTAKDKSKNWRWFGHQFYL